LVKDVLIFPLLIAATISVASTAHAAPKKSGAAKATRNCLSTEALKKYEEQAKGAATSFERLAKDARSTDVSELRVKQALREGGLVKRVPLTSAAEEVPLREMLRDAGFVNIMDCPDLRRQVQAGKTSVIPAGAVVIYNVGQKREVAIRTIQDCNIDSGADTCAIPVKKKYIAIFVK